ncbi:MAG: 30S ribosomal protein S17 [Bacilli bacterium]|jgi:small subunit ribosomal protein S17|nr:30S ribosomal protein S17 [Bacilli bacterium]MDD2681637.1 30S ribosomal protein S17 [Bacilli bacterium]MDD3120968.1 30S ribosomal protein S17 [Bacilli bacterium]MDD4063142.1 30S ribosomal protein S17 [Bacilli bacterium]MDD4481782.1 30S ribosomal protein S17 [Bacilli bacterium]
MERNSRKIYTGTVVSVSNDKTIKVEIVRAKRHPIYGKRVIRSSKLTAHDEKNECQLGDKVKIMETRPLSKTKHFRLVEIIEKAIQL